MIHIHDKEINKIASCHLLHDIINPPRRVKFLNSHYYPIIHVCMNTRKGRASFKNFRILLVGGCSYTIVMVRMVENLS